MDLGGVRSGAAVADRVTENCGLQKADCGIKEKAIKRMQNVGKKSITEVRMIDD